MTEFALLDELTHLNSVL